MNRIREGVVIVVLACLAACGEDVDCYTEGAVRTREGCECPAGTHFEAETSGAGKSSCIRDDERDAASAAPSDAAEGGDRDARSAADDEQRADASSRDVADPNEGGGSDAEVRLDAGASDSGSSVDAGPSEASTTKSPPDAAPACIASAEACDGNDNDCDQSIDEGVLNACGTCGSVPSEVCDNVDNNCDGMIDEGFTKNACGGCAALTETAGKLCLTPRATCAVTGRYACAGTDSLSCESTATCAPLMAPSTKQLAGNGFTCALYGDGYVQCWGKNDWGQLGNGTRIDSTQPVDVLLPGKARTLVKGASENSACADVEGQTSYCWGIGFNPSLPSKWSAIPNRGGIASSPQELE